MESARVDGDTIDTLICSSWLFSKPIMLCIRPDAHCKSGRLASICAPRCASEGHGHLLLLLFQASRTLSWSYVRFNSDTSNNFFTLPEKIMIQAFDVNAFVLEPSSTITSARFLSVSSATSLSPVICIYTTLDLNKKRSLHAAVGSCDCMLPAMIWSTFTPLLVGECFVSYKHEKVNMNEYQLGDPECILAVQEDTVFVILNSLHHATLLNHILLLPLVKSGDSIKVAACLQLLSLADDAHPQRSFVSAVFNHNEITLVYLTHSGIRVSRTIKLSIADDVHMSIIDEHNSQARVIPSESRAHKSDVGTHCFEIPTPNSRQLIGTIYFRSQNLLFVRKSPSDIKWSNPTMLPQYHKKLNANPETLRVCTVSQFSSIIAVQSVNANNVYLWVGSDLHVKPCSWMGDLASRPGWIDLSIHDVACLGTHNSGSCDIRPSGLFFCRKNQSMVGADMILERRDLARFVDWVPFVHRLVTSWSISQSLCIRDQLHLGARYLDVRVAHQNGDYYTLHALTGTPVKSLLEQVCSFVSEYPLEIICIDFNHMYDMSEEQHFGLVDMIMSTIGISRLVPRQTREKLSLNDMWKNQQSVVILYGHDPTVSNHPNRTLLWKTSEDVRSVWPNAHSLDNLHQRLKSIVKQVKPYYVEENNSQTQVSWKDQFYVLQSLITPDTSMIARGILLPLWPNSLRKIAKSSNTFALSMLERRSSSSFDNENRREENPVIERSATLNGDLVRDRVRILLIDFIEDRGDEIMRELLQINRCRAESQSRKLFK